MGKEGVLEKKKGKIKEKGKKEKEDRPVELFVPLFVSHLFFLFFILMSVGECMIFVQGGDERGLMIKLPHSHTTPK